MIKVEKKTSGKNLNTNVVNVKINLFMLKINEQIEKLARKEYLLVYLTTNRDRARGLFAKLRIVSSVSCLQQRLTLKFWITIRNASLKLCDH